MSGFEGDAAHDRELGMDRPIARRDFLNGMAVALGGALTTRLPLADAFAAEQVFPQDASGYYPPALTGMRGSHDGSFAAAHQLRDRTFWKNAPSASATNESYDLVVVGGGISGLSAAHFYRKHAGRNARILILDNHDDVGGHAKRNEFAVKGRLLVTNGGTAGIESPFAYSRVARGLMDELGIDPVALTAQSAKQSDRRVFQGLQSSVFFDRQTFGEDRLVAGTPAPRAGTEDTWTAFLARTPLSAAAQRDIVRLETAAVDYMPGVAGDQLKNRLSRISYRAFLLNHVKVDPGLIPYYQTRTHGLYGVGIDAVGALECWALGYPGFRGMQLDRVPGGRLSFTARGEVEEREPYGFHHPDGGASVARHLLRALIPSALPGRSAEDIVTARADYAQLDRSGAPLRIRLSSTVARVRHAGDPGRAHEVEVAYLRGDRLYTVRARHVVLACWNMMIPFICEGLSRAQEDALRYGVKVPLVYTAVALTNWRAFEKLEVARVATPGMYHTSVNLEFPTSLGQYNATPSTPDDPVIVRMLRTPCRPGQPARVQHRAGHADLYATPFATFERNIREQLSRVLGGGGFDPATDIAAITVNRWPHGYAYEYNPLWDEDWPAGQRPCEIARRRFGRIAIANSDAAAAAYMDQAMDQGFRAVEELIALESGV